LPSGGEPIELPACALHPPPAAVRTRASCRLTALNRRLVFNSVLLAGSVLITAAAAEFVLRVLDYPPASFSPWISDADTAYRYAPNVHTRMSRPPEYDVAFSTNSLGLRDDEVGEKRGPRVLLMGDSFASGYGVERADTIASLLEDELAVEVVNAGVGGYELIHQAHYFDSRGRKLDADLVVLLLYLGNDLSRNHEWRETTNGGLESVSRTYPTRMSSEFKLGRLYRQLRYRTRLQQSARSPWQPFDDYLALCEREPGTEARRAYQQSRHYLDRLRTSVESAGAGFMVAMFSYRTTVESEARAALEADIPGFNERFDLERPARELEAFFAESRIDYINLISTLRRSFGEDARALYFPIDGHFTPEGNRVVAASLAGPLRERLATGAR
jgi:hypothetical protein